MSHYRNFKTVIYCIAHWTDQVWLEHLEKEYEFLEKYIGVDKVYLETYRDVLASKEQILMIKEFFEKKGVEVSGGITTVTSDLTEEDQKRQRIFHTFCYCNEAMRKHLKEVVEYTASFFDEFIIDDFFFTGCRCEDCQREKGNRSWEEFRLEKMREVSEHLVIGPAKKVNPKVKIIIKYPNWAESYQETGYNVPEQKEIFDAVYTGTETRDIRVHDQHLPHYLSYSLMRYMEHAAPGRNGGGWFDAYECYSIDTYLEQLYLTVFSKPREVMLFNGFLLYQNVLATGLGLQMKKLDDIMSHVGEPVGCPVYLPYNAQGEDHVEDALGMLGIPMEPTPDFPEQEACMFLTESALKDQQVVEKLKQYVNRGGQAIVTSGFMIGALRLGLGIEEMTSIRYRNRHISAVDFEITDIKDHTRGYVSSREKIEFPWLEHRNNATWSLMNAGTEEVKAGILLEDTYGLGKLYTLTIPEMTSQLKYYPMEALTLLRYLFSGTRRVYLEAVGQISLFTYDNDTFGTYCYITEKPAKIKVHVKGNVKALKPIRDEEGQILSQILGYNQLIQPLYVTEKESVFEVSVVPGEFGFFQINE